MRAGLIGRLRDHTAHITSLDDFLIGVEKRLKAAKFALRDGGAPGEQIEKHYIVTACRRVLRLTQLLSTIEDAKYAIGHDLRTHRSLQGIRDDMIEMLRELPGGAAVHVHMLSPAPVAEPPKTDHSRVKHDFAGRMLGEVKVVGESKGTRSGWILRCCDCGHEFERPHTPVRVALSRGAAIRCPECFPRKTEGS